MKNNTNIRELGFSETEHHSKHKDEYIDAVRKIKEKYSLIKRE
jgi:hypothetical protein